MKHRIRSIKSRLVVRFSYTIKRTLSPSLGYGTLVNPEEVIDKKFGY